MSLSHDDVCGTPTNAQPDRYRDVRIAAVFVILVSSGMGAYLPIVTGKVQRFSIPHLAFDAIKFFGSGVVISTAFIHLLAPGLAKLSSPCLDHIWHTWPFGLTFVMIAMLLMFLGDVVALRLGEAKADSLGKRDREAGRQYNGSESLEEGRMKENAEVRSGSFASSTTVEGGNASDGLESQQQKGDTTSGSQVIGVMVLEFGVILHSFIVGLTLGVAGNAAFVSLFVVFVFHQFFEGLGMGARLSDLRVPSKSMLPWLGAALFTLTTPIGIAVGIAIHTTFNAQSVQAALSIGILDTTASGILLYSSFIELLAHDFIFNPEMHSTPLKRVLYNVGWLYLGVAIMTLTRYFAHLSH